MGMGVGVSHPIPSAWRSLENSLLRAGTGGIDF